MSKYFIASITFLILFIGSMTIDGMIDIPVIWYAALIITYVILTVIGSIVLSFRYFVPAKSVGAGGVSLTFDDGPIPGKTERILDLLATRNVKATFFCIGSNVSTHSGLVQRIHNEGHLIGNHSYYHKATFDLQSTSDVSKELTQTDAAIASIIGKRPKFFRPPYGVTNPMVARAVSRGNYTVVGWSIRSFDTVIKDSGKLYSRVTKQVRDGDIILFHDHSESMFEVLPGILDHIEKAGLKVVRVDELLRERPYA